MSTATFKGGMHPNDGKALSAEQPIKSVLPKSDLVFPMSQHIGTPAKPVVAVGDKVLAGQIIGEAVGAVSANIICSVSGQVKAIEPRMTVNGEKVLSIVVTNDKEYKTVSGFGEKRDYTKISKTDILKEIKNAGIVGMGGAAFPTQVKLSPKNPDSIDFVIVNGAECEPYLTSDYRMMLEEPEKVVGGLKVLLRLFDKAKGVIAIEDNKPQAIEKLNALTAKEDRISVQILKTKYPQGAERQLIFAVTGRKIHSAMLPADVGCIVDNIDTVISIYMAICENIPLIRRIITVTGDAITNPVNLNVKNGMNYTELVEAAGGFKTQPEKVISGGPMMGTAMFSLDVPVTKSSSALLALTKDEVAENEPTACIRCGRCVAVCPNRLIPQKMEEYASRFDGEGFEKIGGLECYGCGACTYVCPAKRRLTQAFKQTKQSVLASKKNKK